MDESCHIRKQVCKYAYETLNSTEFNLKQL